MYRKMKKRLLAMLLIFCLTGTCLSAAEAAAAAAATEEKTAEENVIYRESFDGADSLGENDLPADWKTEGKTIGEVGTETGRTIETEGERSYYRIDGTLGCAEYVGRVMNDLELPQRGIIEYDFHLEETTGYTQVFFCSSSIKPGTTAIRGRISKDGVVTFFNGGTETKINATIKDAGWVHFKYEYDNTAGSYTAAITDADGALIGKTDTAFAYKDAGAQVGSFAFNMTQSGIVLGIDHIEVKATEEKEDPNQPEEDGVIYRENFNDAGILIDGIPDGWQGAGAIAGTYTEDGNREIRTEGDRSYYHIDARAGEQNKKYIGKVFTNAPSAGSIAYDLKIQTGADIIRLYSYEKSVYNGNLAIRGVIAKDGTTTFFNGSNETKIGTVTYDEWLHILYEYDNGAKTFTVTITNAAGEILAETEEPYSYNNTTAGQVGAFSFSMDGPSAIGVDDIIIRASENGQEPGTGTDDTVAEIVEGQEETVFYSQNFDGSEQLQTSGIPSGWSATGPIAGTYTEPGTWEIRTEGDRTYYYIDSKDGEQNKKYIGKVLSGISKTGWIEYDFNLIKACERKTNYPDIMLSFYPSSINAGNIGISGYITPDGEVYFYNGGSPERIALVKDVGWVHFRYEYNNKKKTYKVTITDEEGNEIGKTAGAFTYRHASGQVGAFSFSMNEPATIGIDNLSVHGYQTPFSFEPEIAPLEQTGKVELEENAGEYILKNDFCKVIISKKNAAITKFYTKEGNEICGANGGGSYLLNYQDSDFVKVNSNDKQETALNNGVGSIIKQTDDYVEISVKEVNLTKERPNNTSVLPIDVDFRFVLEADSPGLYMYAVVDRTDEEADRTFKIEQSRYAIKFDYDRLPYSCVQNGELVKIPRPNDFKDMDHLFDSTYVLNDGSIYTKYNNLSYQYDNILVGAYSNEAGLSLLTPSREWAGGGYSKQDIDVHGAITGSSTVNWHLATSHNGTRPAELECGYKKIYGPIMWYASTDESITSKEAAYQDALAQAQAEAAKWPYQWLTDEDYAADARGSLKGSFSVKNGTVNTEATNDLTPEDSVGWAILSDTKSSSWTLDNAYYEFYAPVKKDGTFEITNILPGTYKLNINVNGVMDEYEQDGIVIGAGEEKDLGAIVWDDPVYGETLWTIGIPDRTAEEYAYAVPYRYWGSHLLFNNLFPEGVDFTVGEDDYTKDWFFVQMASQTAGHKEHYDGAFYYDEESGKVKYDSSKAVPMEDEDERWRGNKLTEYKIRFNSEGAYQEGAVAALLLNVCGNRSGSIRVTLNGTNIVNTAECVTINNEPTATADGDDTAVVSLYSDGSVGRSGLVGINQLVKIEFDASLIQRGENVIVLTHDHPAYQEDNVTAWENSDYTIYAGNIYDAIRLDVDTGKADDTEKPDGSSESTESSGSESSESSESTGGSEPGNSESSESSESTGGSEPGNSESSESSESTGGSEPGSSESSESTGGSEPGNSESSESSESAGGSEPGSSESSESSENAGGSEPGTSESSENTGGSEPGSSESSESTGGNGTGSSGSTENTQDSQTRPGQPDGSVGNTECSETKSSEPGGAAGNSETTKTSESADIKGQTTVVLQNKTVTYNKKAVAVEKATVTGSTGNVTYLYYTDAACTKQTTKKNSGAAGAGQAPKYAGTYYVRAHVAADAGHSAAVSNVAKLTIKKAASKVTLKKRTVRYTGKAVSVKKATVKGSAGKVTYTYYKDKKCKTKTTKKNAGAKKKGQAPKNVGTYYVKASVKADRNYKAAASKAVKLVIKK